MHDADYFRRPTYRPSRWLPRVAQAALLLYVVTEPTLYVLYGMVVADPDSLGTDLLLLLPLLFGLIGQLAAWVVTPLSFLAWHYRAHANVRAHVTRPPSFAPWATWVSWFLPLTQLVAPPVVLHDTIAGLAPRRGDDALVIAWWLAFLAACAASIASFACYAVALQGSPSDPSLAGAPDAVLGIVGFGALAWVLHALAAAALIALIERIERGTRELARKDDRAREALARTFE